MKFRYLSSALAVAALALPAVHARATVVPTNQVGDLVLGFEASGSADDLEVDLGPISQFVNATSAFNVTFGDVPSTSTVVTSLNSDLGIFNGSGTWQTNSALVWGLAGLTPDSSHFNLFLSQDAVNTTNPGTFSFGGESTPKSGIESLVGPSGLGGSANDGFSTAAAAVPTGNANSWSSFNPSTSAFQSGIVVEQVDGDPAIGSTLNLFEATPNSSGSGPATDIGSFALNSAGDLTFTPASVPEASTWAYVLGGGTFLMGVLRFRRDRRTS